VEQAEGWAEQAQALKAATGVAVEKSHEFAAEMMNAIVTDTPYTAYANLPNTGQVPQLPLGRGGRDADAGGRAGVPAHDRHRYPAATGRADAHARSTCRSWSCAR
jgi:hypothetical protein